MSGAGSSRAGSSGLKFILMVNKQGQTRLANYYEWLTIDERNALEAEIIRKCLSRTESQCSFMEYRGMKIIYRRYAGLFFSLCVVRGRRPPQRARAHRAPRRRRRRRTRARDCTSPPHQRPPPAQDITDNELSYVEAIHCFVEMLDRYFGNVCELDLVFNFHKVYAILDEYIVNGEMQETSQLVMLDRLKELEKQLM
jgi:AP-4 complex subunit sigma-1